jgi:hypothetical protein
MKNLLLLIIFILWSSYYFIPYETKIELLEKIWVDSSFLPVEEEEKIEKWEIVNLKFDEITYKTSFIWNISDWVIMKDLSWASLPFVKCFTPDKYSNFNWNTVLHRVLLWKKKNVIVKLISDNDNLNMYVYKTDALSKIYPPKKDYVHDCKTSISISSREINMNWNSVTSDIVVWIVWSNWALEWEYTLELEEK